MQAQAAKDVMQVFPDPTIFPAFSSQMRTTLADRQARTEALLASYTDTSDAAGEAYYKAHASQFASASGKDVAHILLKTKAQAQAVLDQLKGGASFATLAEKDSTDTDERRGQAGRSGMPQQRRVRRAVRDRGRRPRPSARRSGPCTRSSATT